MTTENKLSNFSLKPGQVLRSNEDFLGDFKRIQEAQKFSQPPISVFNTFRTDQPANFLLPSVTAAFFSK